MASQVAAALCLAALGQGPATLVCALLAAAALVAAAWVRLNRRWLYQWLAVAVRFATRRRTLAAGADLLGWVSPGARLGTAECDGQRAGVIEDGQGYTVLVEMDDPGTVPPAGPGIAWRLVVAGFPAAGSGVPAASYRQLTGGRVLAGHRAVLAARAPDPVTVRAWLRRSGRLALTASEASAVLADLAHHDGARGARERWAGVHLGGLVQATFEVTGADVARLLALPASVTVAVGTDHATVRLAAPDPAALATAVRALHRLATATRRDGDHRHGLAATLPIGGDHSGPPSAVHIGLSGLVLGVDRRGDPVVAQAFRPRPTRILLVGGPRTAQRLTMRAMALGAHVVVRGSRPAAWEPFARWACGPGEHLPLLAAHEPVPRRGRPLLVVEDGGPAGGDAPAEPWHTALVVRDELTPAVADSMAEMDLVILPPLAPGEAALAAAALGLTEAGEWFARIHGGMVAVVERRRVRWALLSGTDLEDHLLGPPGRG